MTELERMELVVRSVAMHKDLETMTVKQFVEDLITELTYRNNHRHTSNEQQLLMEHRR